MYSQSVHVVLANWFVWFFDSMSDGCQLSTWCARSQTRFADITTLYFYSISFLL